MRSIIFALSLTLGSFAFAHSGHDHGNETKEQLHHLEFANGTVHAHATFEGPITVGQESKLKIEWKNGQDHSPIQPPGDFEVVLWMPSMNHGSAPVAIAPVLSPAGQPVVGSYLVSKIYFVMGGDWEVRVSLKNKDAVKETQVIELNLAGGHGHN